MSETKHTAGWTPIFSRWRHGGWYVHNIRYPSGGCGCVSNNYTDKKWRIACDNRPFEYQPAFSSRTDAANAEREYAAKLALLEACKASQVRLFMLDGNSEEYKLCGAAIFAAEGRQ